MSLVMSEMSRAWRLTSRLVGRSRSSVTTMLGSPACASGASSASWAKVGTARKSAPETAAQRHVRKVMRGSAPGLARERLFDEDVAPGRFLELGEARRRRQVRQTVVEVGEIDPVELGQPGRPHTVAVEQREDRI